MLNLQQQVVVSRVDCFNDTKFWIEFNGNCLKSHRVTFDSKKIINLYITFEIKSWPFYVDNKFTLRNSLFGAVKFTKNADPDKYSYSGYRFWFDVGETFSL